MGYEEWVKEALAESKRVNSKYNLHPDNFGVGQKQSFEAYIHYKQWEENKKLTKITWWLMFATWVLAIATILLVMLGK